MSREGKGEKEMKGQQCINLEKRSSRVLVHLTIGS